VEAFAQETAEPINCLTAPKLTRPKSKTIVSFGVLNGKAINLVTPKFPAAALAIGVRGHLIVQIVVDPRGCVSEAHAVSGHPLLISASVQAALESSFVPVTLSGNPIWMNGVITYNYVSDKANWLEMGFLSDSPKKLVTYLPPEFERFRTQLKAAEPLPYFQREKTIAATLDSISVELIPFPKERWLFNLGRKLNAISESDYGKAEGFAGAINELKTFVESAPTTVSPQLIVHLNQLIEASPSPAFWKQLKEIEARMFHLGN
jgi:hypothetical protein